MSPRASFGSFALFAPLIAGGILVFLQPGARRDDAEQPSTEGIANVEQGACEPTATRRVLVDRWSSPIRSAAAREARVGEPRPEDAPEQEVAERDALRFQIIDAQSQPLVGIRVSLYPARASSSTGAGLDIDWDGEIERMSDHAGIASFARPDGAYVLAVQEPGEESSFFELHSLSSGTHRIQLPGDLLWTAEVLAAKRCLELRIRTCDGAPAASAKVALKRGDQHLGTAWADAHGAARFPPQERPCTVYIDAPPAAMHARYLADLEGAIEISLPRGAIVAGRFAWTGEPGMGEAAIELRRRPVRGEPRETRAQAAKADDSFRFTGLDDSWSGTLVLDMPPTWHAVAVTSNGRANARFATRRSGAPRDVQLGSPQDIALDAPADDLVIHVQRARSVRGRLRHAETDAAVAAGVVELYVHERPSADLYAEAKTDEHGRFAAPFAGSIERLWLRAGVLEGEGEEAEIRSERRFAIDVPADGDVDVGDLALAVERALSFRLVDERGAPIAGGVAGCRTPFAARFSEPTDAKGAGVIHLLHDANEIHFAAPEKVIASVPIPPADRTSLEVAMTPGCRIDVRTVDGDGRLAAPHYRPAVRRRLYCDEDPVGGTDPELNAQILDRIGATRLYWIAHRGFAWLHHEPNPLPVSCLRPGLVYRVCFESDLPEDTPREHRLSLAPGSSQIVEFRMDSAAREANGFCGIVLDPDGRQLDSIHLGYESASGSGDLSRHDRRDRIAGHEHTFCIPSAITEPLRLQIDHAECAPLLVEDLRFPANAERVATFRLERGHSVVLRIRDAVGRDVIDAHPRAEIASWQRDSTRRLHGTNAEPGAYRFDHLPAGELRFLAEIAGQTYEVRHDPARPEAVLSIPVHGALRVRLGARITWPGAYQIALAPLDAGGRELSTRFEVQDDDATDAHLEHRFPHVPPGRYRVELRDLQPPSRRDPSFGGFAPAEVVVTSEATTVVLVAR